MEKNIYLVTQAMFLAKMRGSEQQPDKSSEKFLMTEENIQ
jgi:hypothetical protein